MINYLMGFATPLTTIEVIRIDQATQCRWLLLNGKKEVPIIQTLWDRWDADNIIKEYK